MARRRLYIPKEVKVKIKEHLDEKYPLVLDGYYSASEEEDGLTSDFGGVIRIKNQKVKVIDNEINGTWTWSINYTKFRGRGNNATEKRIGADGIIELELKMGNRIETKSALFQSKKNLVKDSKILGQILLLTTWREAAFVLNFEPEDYEVYTLDSILKSGGKKPSEQKVKNIAEFLGTDFLDCIIGDTDLKYDARRRILRWRSMEGITVATKFSIPHRLSIKVNAPQKSLRNNWYNKEIENSEIHNYRMDATVEEMLSLPKNYSHKDLKKARNEIAKLYHPDRYGFLNLEGLEKIITRRMQEANFAYEELEKIKKRKD